MIETKRKITSVTGSVGSDKDKITGELFAFLIVH